CYLSTEYLTTDPCTMHTKDQTGTHLFSLDYCTINQENQDGTLFLVYGFYILTEFLPILSR
ncbi:MAG: hypothetical protein ACK55I_44345, partial [bacterium]